MLLHTFTLDELPTKEPATLMLELDRMMPLDKKLFKDYEDDIKTEMNSVTSTYFMYRDQDVYKIELNCYIDNSPSRAEYVGLSRPMYVIAFNVANKGKCRLVFNAFYEQEVVQDIKTSKLIECAVKSLYQVL